MEFNNNDPQNQPEETRPEHLNVAGKVYAYLRNHKHLSELLSDFDDTDIGAELLYILNDEVFCSASEKIALMHDVRDAHIERLANWVEQNYTTDPVATNLWKEAVND